MNNIKNISFKKYFEFKKFTKLNLNKKKEITLKNT